LDSTLSVKDYTLQFVDRLRRDVEERLSKYC